MIHNPGFRRRPQDHNGCVCLAVCLCAAGDTHAPPNNSRTCGANSHVVWLASERMDCIKCNISQEISEYVVLEARDHTHPRPCVCVYVL